MVKNVLKTQFNHLGDIPRISLGSCDITTRVFLLDWKLFGSKTLLANLLSYRQNLQLPYYKAKFHLQLCMVYLATCHIALLFLFFFNNWHYISWNWSSVSESRHWHCSRTSPYLLSLAACIWWHVVNHCIFGPSWLRFHVYLHATTTALVTWLHVSLIPIYDSIGCLAKVLFPLLLPFLFEVICILIL